MKILIIGALPLLSLLAFSQNAEQPRFLAADVHMSAKTQNQFMRPPSTRGDRYAPSPLLATRFSRRWRNSSA